VVANDQTELDRLVNAVREGNKYRSVAPELIRALGAAELQKRRNWKDAVKATKNKLHQVAGAYQSGKADYAAWLEAIQATADNPAALRQTCAGIMAHHASTRERLSILDDFYITLFADLPPFSSIFDLACGLNPLTLAWMPLPQPITYYACDVYADQVAFLQQFFSALRINGHATVCDLIHIFPSQPVDVALLLKTIPCLEQMDKSIGLRLLTSIQAKVLFVSFPAQSLGGRGKGMAANYAAHFAGLIAGQPWTVEPFEFATELVFRVIK
jgi:16S rRNA (guanine(1405)-N(7))-methyltransferase